MWNKTEFDFGKVGENTMLSCTFVYTGDKKITTVKPDCGCTTVSAINNEILVKYKTKPVPAHLAVMNKDFYDLKQIRVIFEDNSVDILKIKAVVCKELH